MAAARSKMAVAAVNLAPVNWVNHDAFIEFTLAYIGLFIRVIACVLLNGPRGHHGDIVARIEAAMDSSSQARSS